MAEDNVKDNVVEDLPVYGFGENYSVQELVPVLADVGGADVSGTFRGRRDSGRGADVDVGSGAGRVADRADSDFGGGKFLAGT